MSANEKIAVIHAYLREAFPNSEVVHKRDFDRCAQSFKVRLADRILLLKVGDELIGDNDAAEILRLFNLWSLAEILGKEKELGVLVSQRGPETFHRDN